MSGMENAMETRSKASEWLVTRRAAADWSEADQAALDAWLAQSPANRIAYWRLEAAWNQAQRLTVLRRPADAPRMGATRAGSVVRIVSALALIAAIAAAGAFYVSMPTTKTYATPIGGHLTVALSDGSKIELNTDTVLRLSDGAHARVASLEKGEAYFQIKHDTARPFSLSAGGHRVVDLGTKFSVRERADRVEIMLIEGRASIEAEDAGAQRAVLKPGDVAIATRNSLSVLKKPIREMNDKLAWRQGMLSFKYVTLAEAAGEFNRYNDTKIIIADTHVAHLTIYGTFPAKDVAAFADAAQAYFQLHVVNRGGSVVISR